MNWAIIIFALAIVVGFLCIQNSELDIDVDKAAVKHYSVGKGLVTYFKLEDGTRCITTKTSITCQFKDVPFGEIKSK